ncbi:sugar phosphate isomerase/epimerase family protein [Ramlibacter sp. Leaf400]|uniref:sugar phosphate isomerase/epimerase family protein n=1 Tax=Ramlibacter sp. Leaf400 TaxID=1736365 RepID=UPI0006F54A5B|nr:glutamine ABC transporter ATP-binding protein [Ramlibacter sp. Leaf400]
MQQVLISLSSFGAAQVRRHGQPWFTRLAQQAGADGVEVRSELLVDPATELPAIARAVRAWGAPVVYSSAEPLWGPDGTLDFAAVQRAVDAARLLGAARLKMSIGDARGASRGDLRRLAESVGGVELLIENDQTAGAGTVDALQAFFRAAEEAGSPLAMTFDMGNWHWAGEEPLDAARTFAARVRYVHCKGVQQHGRRWGAVPLADSAAPWRAVLRALPRGLPWAIEYPLVGDDLLQTTRGEIAQLREASARLGAFA